MNARVTLIVLQAAGALTLLAYPGVLLASIMSLGAPGTPVTLAEHAFRAGLYLALVYPVVWLALWSGSWVAYRRGRPAWAIVLSMPPVLVVVAGIALSTVMEIGALAFTRQRMSGGQRSIDAQNPVAGALWSMGNGGRRWSDVRTTIATADAGMLSKPVDEYGTPLRLAITSTFMLTSLDFGEGRPQFLDAARLLLSRGAHLTPDEELRDPGIAWFAEVLRRGRTLPDPSAKTENPLVWRIVTCGPHEWSKLGMPIHEIARAEPHLLRKPTSTYGTPLRATFLRGFHELAYTLISTGAVLSDEERAIPGLTRQVEQYLAAHPDLRETYAVN